MNKGAISLYGDAAIGVVDVASAECFYQQDRMQEALIQVAGILSLIEQKGNISTLFAAMYVEMQVMLVSGQFSSAKPLLDNITDKIKEVKADFLRPNLEAIWAKFALYENHNEEAQKWAAEKAPDENIAFCTMDRFKYFIKLRVYILYEKYYLAIALAAKLKPICTAFQRYMELAELDMLLAITFYRMGLKEKAEQYMADALKLGEKYGYIRLFADEGEPVYKVLKNLEEVPGISRQYIKQVKEAAKKIAMLNPSYLVWIKNNRDGLSASELEVIQLQAQGKTNNEIADYLNISLNTVKFHIKNIYSKLGVKNRFQAVQQAKAQGIIK